MATMRFEVDKFTGENDFSLWRIKMKALLVQQGLSSAIDEEAMAKLKQTDVEKAQDIEAMAHSAILLSLGDDVLREVSGETQTLPVWEKLQVLYMKKSLANRLHIKKKLYTLHMEEGKDLRKHLGEFNKVMLDLTNIGAKIDEEDPAIILLSSLPKLYEHFVDTMLYGKQTFTMSEMKSALNSKELQRMVEMK